MINSIDNDGLMGYDLDLIKLVSKKINCPILALGGAGNWQHILIYYQNRYFSSLHTKYFSFH